MEQFDVATPLSYLVQFNDDATLNVVADCNNAAGSYQGEGGKLQIELGPMTAAACPPDSRSDQFVRLLGGAALYFFQDGNLHIDLFADAGTMVFSPAPPDIFGDDGEGAVAGLPDTLVATLGNQSYSGLFDDREITLTGGVYTATSDAETIVVHLLDSFVALGDLNGDGSQDAVALLELDTSGSGRFTFAAPVLDVLTTPTVGTAVEVEDRIQPKTVTIADGQVVVEYIGHGEGDGDCCPSWNIRHTFAWQDGALAAVGREEVSKVEAAAPASSLIRTDAWAPVACDTLGVAPELAAVAECGYVTVPENRAAGTDKTIQLAVVRVPSTSAAPGAPVILGTGGPGRRGTAGRHRCGRQHLHADTRRDPGRPGLGLLHPARHASGQARAELPGLQQCAAGSRQERVERRGEAGPEQGGHAGLPGRLCGPGRRPDGLQLGRERRRHRRPPPGAGLRQDHLLRRVLWHAAGAVPAACAPGDPGCDHPGRHRTDDGHALDRRDQDQRIVCAGLRRLCGGRSLPCRLPRPGGRTGPGPGDIEGESGVVYARPPATGSPCRCRWTTCWP